MWNVLKYLQWIDLNVLCRYITGIFKVNSPVACNLPIIHAGIITSIYLFSCACRMWYIRRFLWFSYWCDSRFHNLQTFSWTPMKDEVSLGQSWVHTIRDDWCALRVTANYRKYPLSVVRGSSFWSHQWFIVFLVRHFCLDCLYWQIYTSNDGVLCSSMICFFPLLNASVYHHFSKIK